MTRTSIASSARTGRAAGLSPHTSGPEAAAPRAGPRALSHSHANYRYSRPRPPQRKPVLEFHPRPVGLGVRSFGTRIEDGSECYSSTTVAIGGRNAWTTSERVR
jgi:hypothetical protein